MQPAGDLDEEVGRQVLQTHRERLRNGRGGGRSDLASGRMPGVYMVWKAGHQAPPAGNEPKPRRVRWTGSEQPAAVAQKAPREKKLTFISGDHRSTFFAGPNYALKSDRLVAFLVLSSRCLRPCVVERVRSASRSVPWLSETRNRLPCSHSLDPVRRRLALTCNGFLAVERLPDRVATRRDIQYQKSCNIHWQWLPPTLQFVVCRGCRCS